MNGGGEWWQGGQLKEIILDDRTCETIWFEDFRMVLPLRSYVLADPMLYWLPPDMLRVETLVRFTTAPLMNKTVED